MDQKPNDQLMFVLVHKKMLHGEIYEKKKTNICKMESRRRQTITITKANFETCERFLQFCLYINLLKPNSMQHDCLKYFRILINWFGKTYYYFSMIFKNMAIHHLVNCLFYANLRTSIWGWWVTGSGPYNKKR